MCNTNNLNSVSTENEFGSSTLQVIDERKVLEKDFRVYGTFENPLFLAKNVAEWIEYDISSVNKMLAKVDDDEKTVRKIIPSGSNYQTEAWFLTEDGLYEVLMQSTKPIAKQFKSEVKKILHELRIKGEVKINRKVDSGLEYIAHVEAAKLLHELADEYAGASKNYKQVLDAYATKELSGEFLLPLPETKKTYSAAEVGEKLGISANKVGKISNKYGLKTEKLGKFVNDKSKYSDKEVETWRYYDEAIPLIAEHKNEDFKKSK